MRCTDRTAPIALPRYSVHLSPKSGNGKTGPIPVTTTPRAVCPVECVHRGGSCYFENGGSAIFWTHVDAASAQPNLTHSHVDTRGRSYSTSLLDWWAFVDLIRAGGIKPGLARFAQGGDLPGDGRRIDRDAVLAFADASHAAGVRWIVYTHYVFGSPRAADLLHNVSVIRAMGAAGVTVNVSCDTLAQVDTVRALGLHAAVTVASTWNARTARTPAGNALAQCPATYRDTGPGSSCATCGGCAVDAPNRATWAFPAHGSRKGAVDSRLDLFAREGVTPVVS